MSAPILTEELAVRFARIALGHVRREYPNKPDHVLAGPGDARTPRELHPVFYGSYDWHSCVHSYWMLARLLRRHPRFEAADDIRALFDEQFIAEKVAAECAYLAAPTARGFKRPYGWGWLLKLAAELVARRNPMARTHRAACGGLCAALSRFPATRDLSGAGRHAFQHCLRAAHGRRLRHRDRRHCVELPPA